MSHFLDRLTFFRHKHEPFANGHGVLTEEDRKWENAYRSRWSHDKIARSTHGVNCTGSCSWKIYVKNGIITWETQQTDYPRTRPDLPNHEPRGCPRGASYSWYVYSAQRIKYPMMRGALAELWREARKTKDPIEAWQWIVEDPDRSKSYKSQRGLGGFVRSNWDEAYEMVAAANCYTIKKYGPDRVIGFSPIPAMSMVSYASGARYLGLIGGVPLSFYDWYCDLPPASPQTWGEQTDVAESADWYNSNYLLVWGSNIPMTRTPTPISTPKCATKAPKPSPYRPTSAKWPSSATSGSRRAKARMPRWRWRWGTLSSKNSISTIHPTIFKTTAAA